MIGLLRARTEKIKAILLLAPVISSDEPPNATPPPPRNEGLLFDIGHATDHVESRLA